MPSAGRRVLPLAMFLGSFAWSFVFVSLPFYIETVSTLDRAATLQWTGWVLGITSLVTVATGPIWGHYADRVELKSLYMLVQTLQGLAFFGMALARTLPELFVARMILGLMGASSTFAFMMVGREADQRVVRREVAAIQSAMTIGQVTGPLAGAIAAARLGFRSSFVVGAGFLFSCTLLVFRGVPAGSTRPAGTGTAAPVRLADVISVVAIVLVGSVHMFFMPAILPQTLPTLGVESTRTLEVGGLLMFASGVGVALGSIVAPRLPELIPERRLIPGLLVAASVFVVGLAVAPTPFVYGGLRFLQVLCVAPVFPLTIARIAQGAGGQTMSVINSARIGAGFVGPVIATTVVAWTAPWVLYALLAAIGVACVPLARQRPPDVHGRQA